MSVNSSDLEIFDNAFTPSSGGFKNMDAVADGDYDWTILTASLDKTAKSNDVVLRLELRVEQTGQVVTHTYFFRSQEQADRLGGDLATLGFDTGTWNAQHGKKFSAELVKAVGQLPGKRFRGTKKTAPNKQDSSKPYHNLYLNALLPDGAAPAAAPTAGDKIPF